jgi:hypothetical protein
MGGFQNLQEEGRHEGRQQHFWHEGRQINNSGTKADKSTNPARRPTLGLTLSISTESKCSNNAELRNVKVKVRVMQVRILTWSDIVAVGRWLMGTPELVLAARRRLRGGVEAVSRMLSPM